MLVSNVGDDDLWILESESQRKVRKGESEKREGKGWESESKLIVNL